MLPPYQQNQIRYYVDWESLFESSDVRIMVYLSDSANHEARYSEILKNVIHARSVLSQALRDLMRRGIIERKVESTFPIQTRYHLSDKGLRVLHLVLNLQKALAAKT